MQYALNTKKEQKNLQKNSVHVQPQGERKREKKQKTKQKYIKVLAHPPGFMCL